MLKRVSAVRGRRREGHNAQNPGDIRSYGQLRGTNSRSYTVALDPAIKQEIIKEYATHEGDTGSPECRLQFCLVESPT